MTIATTLKEFADEFDTLRRIQRPIDTKFWVNATLNIFRLPFHTLNSMRFSTIGYRQKKYDFVDEELKLVDVGGHNKKDTFLNDIAYPFRMLWRATKSLWALIKEPFKLAFRLAVFSVIFMFSALTLDFGNAWQSLRAIFRSSLVALLSVLGYLTALSVNLLCLAITPVRWTVRLCITAFDANNTPFAPTTQHILTKLILRPFEDLWSGIRNTFKPLKGWGFLPKELAKPFRGAFVAVLTLLTAAFVTMPIFALALPGAIFKRLGNLLRLDADFLLLPLDLMKWTVFTALHATFLSLIIAKSLLQAVALPLTWFVRIPLRLAQWAIFGRPKFEESDSVVRDLEIIRDNTAHIYSRGNAVNRVDRKFVRNVEGRGQLSNVDSDTEKAAYQPLFYQVDEEGKVLRDDDNKVLRRDIKDNPIQDGELRAFSQLFTQQVIV